jgi:hypothetical protein
VAFVPELIEEAVALSRSSAGEALAKEVGAYASSLIRSGGRQRAVQLEGLYDSAPIRYGERLGDGFDTRIKTGVISHANTLEHVVVTRPSAEREAKEITAYAVHKESPFTNHFPITVRRGVDGRLVQERVGRSLDTSMALLDKRVYGYEPPPMPLIDSDQKVLDAWCQAMKEHERNSPTLKALLTRSPVFRDQLEQTAAERLLWGDADGASRNITMLFRRQTLKASNIDMEFAFDLNHVPHAPEIEAFQGQPISAATMTKISQFGSHFGSKQGREYLAANGLGEAQTEAMLARTNWFKREGRFPIMVGDLAH